MQEVYKDGSMGRERDFDADEIKRLLEEKNNQIDHFRVFVKDSGNKVGIPEISENKLSEMIDLKLNERDKRAEMFRGFEMLKAEFDRKRKL